VHVVTQKGKGKPYAEENPGLYHGVSAFDPVTGQMEESDESFSSVFGKKLCQLAESDGNICAITAAMQSGTGLAEFAKSFPDRFYDVGIAEEHATSMAAGMASAGLKPVFAVYSTFLQRSYDMLIHDVAISGLHAVFAVDRCGLVGQDGETHHGVFDVAYLGTVPGMKIYAPASFAELRDMLDQALEKDNCPVAVRYPRGGEGRYTDGGCEPVKVLRRGTDYTIVSYGVNINDALDAADILDRNGVSAEVIKLGIIAPGDFGQIKLSAEKTGHIMVLEEVDEQNCVGERIAAYLACSSVKSIKLQNLGSGFVTHGTVAQLKKLCAIDSQSVADTILKELGK
jgi:1-deoxy-D-xylulose-5-phosphate synthase